MLSPTTSPCLCIVWYPGSGEGGATRIFVTAYAAAAAVATIAVGTSVAVAVTPRLECSAVETFPRPTLGTGLPLLVRDVLGLVENKPATRVTAPHRLSHPPECAA
jgi:hypothetical protein